MKIPTYTSGVAPTSEAPGRSFSSRMSAQPFVAEAQARGDVFGEAAQQIGAYSQMRYKAARETQISEKVLAAEEALREKAREFSNTPTGKLGSVFNDGGDPNEGMWSKSTSETLTTLLSDVKDRESRRILTDRYNQMELTQRFRLRGVVDSKLEAATAAARAAQMRNAESVLSQAQNVDEITAALGNVGVDSARLGALGLGDPNALKKQEYALLLNGANSNVMAYLNQQEVPSEAAERLRLALREDDATLAGDAQVQFAMLKMLPLADQAKILAAASRTANFIDAPTEAEKRAERLADGYAVEAGKQITSYTDDLQNGYALPDGTIEGIEATINQVADRLDPNVQAELRRGVDDLQYINGIVKDVRSFASPSMVQDKIMELEAQKSQGLVDVDERDRVELALDFMRGFKKKMVDGLASDPIAYASRAGSYVVEPIDLSQQAVQSGEAAASIQNRVQTALAIRGHYELTGPLRVFTTEETSQISAQFAQGNAMQKMGSIAGINQTFGKYAPDVIAQIADKEPMFAHVAGLVSDGRFPASEIILKGMERIEAGFKPFEGADVAVAKEEFSALTGAALAMLPAETGANLRKGIYDGAQAYYAEIIARRPDKTFDESLWAESVQAASGFDKQTGRGGIQEVRGVPTLLSPNYTAENLEDAMGALSLEALEEATGLEGTIDADLALDIRDDDDHRLQVLGKRNGRVVYGVVYGEFGDSLYGMMADSDGVPIRFSGERLIQSVTEISNRPATPAPFIPTIDQTFGGSLSAQEIQEYLDKVEDEQR